MKHIVCIFLLLRFTPSIGQNSHAEIKGKVFSIAGAKKYAVKNAKVHLHSFDLGIDLYAPTNDSGYYYFKANQLMGKSQIEVYANAATSFGPKQTKPFSSEDTVLMNLKENKIFIRNFFLGSEIEDEGLPPLLFKKNSTRLYMGSSPEWNGKSTHEGIDVYAKLLKENPELNAEVWAWCDSTEKDPERLSLKRAKAFKKELVKRKIEVDRIRVVGKGVGSHGLRVKFGTIN